MDEDEEKLEALRKKMILEDDPGFLDHLRALWYTYRIMVKKKRIVNALKWVHFQTKLTLYVKSFYFVYIIGMPTEEDMERARKEEEAKGE